MGKEEVVLPLFAINMILYLENHKKPIKIFKQLKLRAHEQGCSIQINISKLIVLSPSRKLPSVSMKLTKEYFKGKLGSNV